MFAQDRNNKVLDDPYLMLVETQEHKEIFKYQPESPEEVRSLVINFVWVS